MPKNTDIPFFEKGPELILTVWKKKPQKIGAFWLLCKGSGSTFEKDLSSVPTRARLFKAQPITRKYLQFGELAMEDK